MVSKIMWQWTGPPYYSVF